MSPKLHRAAILAFALMVAAATVPVRADATQRGTWVATSPLGTSRLMHTATALQDGRALIVGGYDSSPADKPLSSAELFDPATATWSSAGSLNAARALHTATLLADGRVLVAGGAGAGNRRLASAEVFDPSQRTWTSTKTPAAVARSDAVAVMLEGPGCSPHCGKVLLAGGFAPEPSRSAELYDPKTDEWTPTAELTVPRATPVAALVRGTNCGAGCGKVLVAGGYYKEGHKDASAGSAELYDPKTATWAPTGALASPRVSSDAAALADGRVLVAGGRGAEETTEEARRASQIYDPASGEWEATQPLNHPRVAGAWLTSLSDGKVLAAGGSPVDVPAELFDPATGAWTATGEPLEAGYLGSSVLVRCSPASEQVLFTGGAQKSGPVALARLLTVGSSADGECASASPSQESASSTADTASSEQAGSRTVQGSSEHSASGTIPTVIVATTLALAVSGLVCSVLWMRRRRIKS